MRLNELAGRLRAEQAGGAFACTIHHKDGRIEPDRNGFATALVLRELPRAPELAGVTASALDYLERCADPRLRGAYGFWPLDERPPWAHAVPPDCDDSAVIALELLRAGRRSADATVDLLLASLVTEAPRVGPAWIRAFCFPTWLDAEFRRRDNAVDCAVNANVLALLAVCGLQHLPGYAESVAMIEAALAHAAAIDLDLRELALRSLTPYYPDPRVFEIVLAFAIECGAGELRGAHRRLRDVLGVPAATRLALCGNAYAGPIWHCPALDLVRGLTRAVPPVER
jgi:hypothetical protein